VINGNLDLAAQMEADFYTESRVRMTAQALEAIANHVARLPGRKNLVWISAAFPMALNMNLINPLLQRHDFNTSSAAPFAPSTKPTWPSTRWTRAD